MIKSMTGFASLTRDDERGAIGVTIRAVNHRFLDLQLRLPEEMRAFEGSVRDRLAGALVRGRVEARVDIRAVGERTARVVVNRAVVLAAHAAVHPLVEQGLVDRGLAAGDLLRLPEVFRVEAEEGDFGDADQALLAERGKQV